MQEAHPNGLEFQLQLTLDMYTSNGIYVHTSNNVTRHTIMYVSMYYVYSPHVHKIVIG